MSAKSGVVKTRADGRVDVIDLDGSEHRVPRASVALALGAATIDRLGVYPLDALREAARAGRFADQNLEAIDAGLAANR